ncbi:hypothetical protein IJ182_09190 [bacterium]|nr:hypothetical protein [bacterium]
MKKYIILSLFVLAFIGISADSAKAESVIEPQWAEFCPPLYENAVFKPAKENSKRNMENNYWALRKAKFEKSITECKVISKTQSELGMCYSRVANLERNKNNQRKEAQYEKNDKINQQIRDGGYWWY